MQTRSTRTLARATFATTDPHLFERPSDQRVLARLQRSVRLVRYGCDCDQYAMVAYGQLDLVVENQLKPWDILPLVPIVSGAGGVLTNWDGADDFSTGQAVASANAERHGFALAQIQNA